MKKCAWTIYMEHDLIEEVKEAAALRGISVSDLVREALNRFLEEDRRRLARKKMLSWLRAQICPLEMMGNAGG
ncbi:CopG family transcriptional regulator [Thermosulfurimonas sp. F29]|uniref:ribbon-helix-helix domain-containing protein n=1 Tax=Thermosulfurimonas sp. F29 TaxID=2867247 RepID=UPI001C8394A9|nr:CopG family transcriptional regulator [Thermosulfurimonas sp. F29]MBX6424152.1 ribbon-helix-helix domain-containing protein [Thermosulfurimonas sp. F29]